MKRLRWISLFLFCLFKMTACKDCSTITIEPLDKDWRNGFKWTVGVPSITFRVTYNCSNPTNITIKWAVNGTKLDKSSNITSTDTQTTGNETSLLFSNRTRFDTKVKLTNITVNSSLEVLLDDANLTKESFPINVEYCPGGLSYSENKNETCKVETCLSENIYGTRRVTCGKFTKSNMSECKKEEYEFDFTSPELTVPADEHVVFKCDLAFMTLLDGKETTRNDSVKVAISVEDNGKIISCYNREDGNKTDAKTATLNVSTPPRQQGTSSYSVMNGQRSQLEFRFWANDIVPREQIKISHKDNEIADFYFRRTDGILHEILLTLPENKSDGDYIISVNGTSEHCSGTFTATFTESSEPFHIGWITSIALGSVLLISVIVFIVVICRQKKSHDEDIALSSLSTPSAPVQHRTSQPKPTNEVPIATSNHHRTQQFQNDNYQHASDDDEFDNSFDEYEEMTGDDRRMRERPPMPLPPTPRNEPRSPVPPRNGYDSRPLAPPPHRGHGNSNTMGFAPPPMRSVPMPPPHGMRQQQMPGHPSSGQGFDLGYHR